jgi:hypothetical protein
MRLVHDPFISGDNSRPDCDWDWRWEIPLIAFGGGLVRRPRLFQLCLAADDFPLAMVALLENERWIYNQSQSAVYLWYLAGAPATTFGDRPAPKLLTAAGLDIAITVSLNGPAKGRLWLHAAPEGGANLLKWYAGRGLASVPAKTILPGPRISKRYNDGRYFCLTPATAVIASDAMNEYRV